MFQYFFTFLLINSYCQSLGSPIQQNHSISDPLADLAQKCANKFLVNAITNKIKDCAIPVHHTSLSNNIQIRCLIFYDINKQLCSAVAASKLTLADEYKIEKNDVDTLCTLAKNWNFTSLPEKVFKSSTICGEICGSEVVGEANDFCNYYKWGKEILTTQALSNNNVDKNVIESPVIPEPDSNSRADIAVPINNNLLNQQKITTKIPDVQSKPNDIDVPKSASDNTNEGSDVAVLKSTDLTTSKKPSNGASETNIEKNEEVAMNVDVPKPVADVPEVGAVNQGNKSTVTNEIKPDTQNDPLLPSKDIINIDQKDAVLENNEGKAQNDPDEYADPDANDESDDDGDDQGSNIKLTPEKQESLLQSKLPSQNGDIAQKVSDLYPNSDGFSDDGDHFFQFFLTAVILIVLLYVLYHNKNKVSKVFFGLILEGRQDSRRRNSRGHAYRRLDTLEQAMSAKTAAPPSKIIY